MISAVALLDPTAGAGEEPELEPTDPTIVFMAVAPWSAVFIAAASTDAFTTASLAGFVATTLSTATFIAAALSVASFSVAALSVVAFTATALSIATFTAAATFATVTSSVVIVSVASSVVVAAAETSLAVKAGLLLSDLLGIVDAATLGSGYSAVATLGAYCPNSEGPLTMDPPLRNCLILLYRGTSSSSDDTSVSLSMI
jgi:hypothetical protein